MSQNPDEYVEIDPLSSNSSIIARLASSFVRLPPPKLTLQMEIDYYENIIHNEKLNDGKLSKFEVTPATMQLIPRKDHFRFGTGLNHFESEPEASMEEKLALVDIFDRLGGYAWVSNDGWIGQRKTSLNPEIKPFEAAAGLFSGVIVKVDSNEVPSVQRLNFQAFGCYGVFPESIGQLLKLEMLELDSNAISGILPLELSKLTKLQTLTLSNNLISGTLSVDIFSSFTHMIDINLSFNHLEGDISDTNLFKQMINLEKLNIACNAFSGALPDLSSNLKLKELKLYGNKFTGLIPSHYSCLLELKELNLSDNNIRGGIASLYQCKKLEILNLSHNIMCDKLEEELGNLTYLCILYLDHNRFSGIFLDSWCHLTNLKYLNLRSNCLTGTLPLNIGMLENLEVLILCENKIVGPTPISLGSLTKLRDFQLFDWLPTEAVYPSRGFNSKSFQNIYKLGPSIKIDNVHW